MLNLTVPDILPLVNEYIKKEGNTVGGSYHILLDDGNVRDADVEFCLDRCRERNESLGIELGEKLLLMSKTQRSRLTKMWDYDLNV